MATMRHFLTFPPDRVREPIIYQLGKDFDLVTTIRRATVTATRGWATLEVEGREEHLDRGVAWLRAKGVQVDPIEQDVTAP